MAYTGWSIEVSNLKSIILISGLVIMLAMGIYPPWNYQSGNGKQVPMGYGFIWAPPQEKIDKKGNLFGFKFDIEVGMMKANSIDIVKLLIQEAIAAGITFGAAAIAGKPNPPSKENSEQAS